MHFIALRMPVSLSIPQVDMTLSFSVVQIWLSVIVEPFHCYQFASSKILELQFCLFSGFISVYMWDFWACCTDQFSFLFTFRHFCTVYFCHIFTSCLYVIANCHICFFIHIIVQDNATHKV